MPAVTAFTFYTDPVAKTGGTSVTVDPVGQTITLAGVTAFPFAKCPVLKLGVRALANQDLSDKEGTPGDVIFNDDGTVLLNLSCSFTTGTPPVVNQIGIGTPLYSKVKALDFADGLALCIPGCADT